ncbi:3-isopropylmalate dehydrogenase [Acidipropionibacterium jensenii]|uniref:3-isopropylmalate dehydrogenase n=1 Tax=Acidipropionibacterium jensenii TaxID=1749 RepID=UPI00214C78DD|nr:3-isopropylmalate dehydrogenase [Acidipropionibacterium jensenii]
MTNDASSSAVPTLAVIGGDGIGPEVTAEALKVLTATIGDDAFTTRDYSLGAEHWKATGEVLDDDTLAEIATADAIVLGAVGAAPGSTEVPSGLLERGLLLKLRFSLDQGVNLRPSTWYPGTPTPLSEAVTGAGPIDFVVCREGTEGLYCGNGGAVRVGTPQEIATEVSLNTAFGVERVVRDAFTRARARRRHLTLVHKHNVLVNAGSLWRRVVDEVAADFPEVEHDYLHVDAVTIALVKEPQRFDVIVTDNLFGDIITDLAGAVTGGIGLAPSANINTSGQYPSMFEPVHGSAPDIAGTGRADPTAAISSMALLLDHLGRPADAERIRTAVSADIASRLGAPARSTTEIGDAIAALI